jgi:hypothetical protein
MHSRHSALLCSFALFLLCLAPLPSWAIDFQFSWQPNSESSITEYRLYYGSSSGDYDLNNYTEIDTQPDPITGLIAGTISNLDENKPYYFAVTACTEEVESDFSTEITYSPPIVTLTSPVDGAFYAVGETIEFTGSAIDLDGYDISESLQWDSDISGNLGTGAVLALDGLTSGTHYISASVTDNNGQLHKKTISLAVDNPDNLVTFDATSITIYNDAQYYGDGSVTIDDAGETISLTGNRWIKTETPYSITPDTILEFDFNSTAMGEIHAIGFDENNDIFDNKRAFQFFGTQILQSAIQVTPKYNDTDTGQWIHFSIAVGEFYTGSNMNLVFINDDDNEPADATSIYRNVRIRHSLFHFDLEEMNNYSHQASNDSAVTVEDEGLSLNLPDSHWIRTNEIFSISPETIIEFDFLSTAEGEIHGIGFDKNDDISDTQRVFQLFGSQSWENAIPVSSRYQQEDTNNWVHFSIPVGQFYTGSSMHMIFVNDDDRDPASGTSKFKNIQKYQAVTKIFGNILHTDNSEAIAETTTNINDSINEGAEQISTWSWSTIIPHQVANTIILKANLSTIPANAYVTEARVYFYQTESIGAIEYKNSIHKITGVNPIIAQVSGYNAQQDIPWAEVPEGTSHNNVPMGLGNIAEAEDTLLLDTSNGYKSWDITAMTQDWINNPDTNFGFLIQGEATTVETGRIFAASENQDSNIRPFIVLRYTMEK